MIGYPDICTGASTDVDHVVPGDDHRLHMLQGACGPCHRRKSAREGGLASGAVRAAKARQRPKSKHPGLV
jgi:5-methylcytosine-specific restriction endonuclease McrA